MNGFRIFLFLCLSLALPVYLAESTTRTHRSSVVDHVQNLIFMEKQNENGRRLSATDAPYGDQIEVAFSAFGKNYNFSLALHDSLLSEDAKIRVISENNKITERKIRQLAYAGVLPEGGWIRATVLQDQQLHITFMENGELHIIEPVWYHFVGVESNHGLPKESHVSYRHSDVVNKNDHWKYVNGIMQRRFQSDKSSRETLTLNPEQENKQKIGSSIDPRTEETNKQDTHRKLATLMAPVLLRCIPWTNSPYGKMNTTCPSSMKTLEIGIAHDTGYTKILTNYGYSSSVTLSSALSLVESTTMMIQNVVNVLYVDEANIYIKVAAMEIRTSTSGSTEAWNGEPADVTKSTGDTTRFTYGCATSRTLKSNNDYLQTLSDLGNWRLNTLPSTSRYGVWHLLTNCYPSGTIGLAWIGVTCTTTRYGAAWSNFQSSGTWETFAHEIGHNFGASHTLSSGGIMSYDNPKEYYFTGTNPSEICGHINKNVNICYKTFSGTCGNGILEPGEECDDTTSCCSACKLVSSAQCSPGSSTQCCSSNCKFLPTTSDCTLCGGKINGYCYNGLCRENQFAAKYSNILHCTTSSSSPCIENIILSGKCYLATYFGSNSYMPNGATCSTDGSKVCSSGTCVSGTPFSLSGLIPDLTKNTKHKPKKSLVEQRSLTLEYSQDLTTTFIVVESPHSGEVIFNGEIALVRWSSSADITHVDIFLGENNLIASNIMNTGQYEWEVAQQTREGYYIIVSSTDGSASGRGSYFIIDDQASITLKPTLENIIFERGQSYTVSWDWTGTIPAVSFDLLHQSGKSFSFGLVENTGQFQFVIPVSIAPRDGYFFKIGSTKPNQDDVISFSRTFSLGSGSNSIPLSVLQPNSDSYFEQGQTYRIIWTSPSNMSTISIRLKNIYNEGYGLNLLQSESNDNYYDWTVPIFSNFSGTGYQIEVFNGRFIAQSQLFTIIPVQPRFKVVDIFEGQEGIIWLRDSTTTIAFEKSSVVDGVRIELMSANETRALITSNTKITQYKYQIPSQAPPENSNRYYLQFTSVLHPTASTQSDIPFSLTSHNRADFNEERISQISFTYPSTNIVWQRGKQYRITWTSTIVSIVDIFVKFSNGIKIPLKQYSPNYGEFVVTVPLGITDELSGNVLNNNLFLGDYQFVVCDSETSNTCSESGTVSFEFPTASSPSISIISPNFSSQWVTQSIATIEWDSNAQAQYLEISLWSDSNKWFIISKNAPTAGRMTFLVPNSLEPSNNYFLKINSTTFESNSDQFSITDQSSISITNIDPSTVWNKGGSYEINWKYTGKDFGVQISLYKGSLARRTIRGEKCISHLDTEGILHRDCVKDPSNYRFGSCATEVTNDGFWIKGGKCQDLVSQLYFVTTLGNTVASTSSFVASTAPEISRLPEFGDDYSVMLSNIDDPRVFSFSPPFSILYLEASMNFLIATPLSELTTLETANQAWQQIFINELATALNENRNRFSVDRIAMSSQSDQIAISPTGLEQSSTLQRNEEQVLVKVNIHQPKDPRARPTENVAEQLFVLWSDPESKLYSGKVGSRIDPKIQPTYSRITTPTKQQNAKKTDKGSIFDQQPRSRALFTGTYSLFGVLLVTGLFALYVHQRKKKSEANKKTASRVQPTATLIESKKLDTSEKLDETKK